MRIERPILKVLMLGWEYPPRFAGGLGKACRGLSVAVARKGAQVFFVLPTFPDHIHEQESFLEVVGAREAMIELGWTEKIYEELLSIQETLITSSEHFEQLPQSFLRTIRSDAVLFPYGVAPSDKMSTELKNILSAHRASGLGGHQTQEVVHHSAVKKTTSRHMEIVRSTQTHIEKIQIKPPSSVSSDEIYGKNLWSEIERFCYDVRLLAETHKVDVIHAHDWMTYPAAFEFQRVTGVPVFLHIHATEYDRSGENVNREVFEIEREGFRRANHIFAVSRYTAGILVRLYGVERKKISVIYNAPDDEAKKIKATVDDERDPNVVFLGRLTFQKGPDHFLRAAQLVAQVNPHAKFLFCGVGDMLDQLRTMAHRLGIEEQVHFTGFLDSSGVDEILKRSKVLVMPSVSEPFGLVPLEALHCGIPVILSKQSGVSEVLQRALHVDFWDHEKLADLILAALRLPDLSRQLVSEGMQQVMRLSWDKAALKVIGAYRKTLSTHGERDSYGR